MSTSLDSFTKEELAVLLSLELKKVKKLENWLKHLWDRYGEGFPQNEIENEIDSYIKVMEGR